MAIMAKHRPQITGAMPHVEFDIQLIRNVDVQDQVSVQ
jgi:hypothetical protein